MQAVLIENLDFVTLCPHSKRPLADSNGDTSRDFKPMKEHDKMSQSTGQIQCMHQYIMHFAS